MIRTIRPAVAPRALAATAVVLGTLALAACSRPAAPAGDAAAISTGTAPMIRQDTVSGAYEMAYDPATDSLYVASTPSFDNNTPGFVHRLDGQDLSEQQVIQLPRRAFALGLNTETDTLYVGNTLDGSLSVLDARGGMLTGTIQLGTPEEDGTVAHTRKVVVDDARNRVFVSSPGQPGKVWIVDGAAGTLTHTIESPGPWSAGLVYDDETNRLYVGQGGIDEVLVIDPDAGRIVETFTTGDTTANTGEASQHFLINLALDREGDRLFATDSNTNQVYVFDTATGEVLATVPIGVGALDVAFNPQRHEIYTTNRGVTREQATGTGAVSVIDATTLEVERTIDLPAHPNSLVVAPGGNTLYVTVKTPHDEAHPAYRVGARDSVVRIDLR